MKKIITLILVVGLLAAAAGCTSGKQSSSGASSNPSSSISQPSSEAPKAEPTLAEIHKAVKDVYGENYIPSSEITEQQLAETYGLNMDDVEEFIAEGPMMSAHVDQFIAIKAKPGKGPEIEKALTAYRDQLVNDTMQYPSNLPKIQSSEVVANGDYVFFVMLGAMNENMDATEEELAEHAKNEVKKGVDKIKEFFK